MISCWVSCFLHCNGLLSAVSCHIATSRFSFAPEMIFNIWWQCTTLQLLQPTFVAAALSWNTLIRASLQRQSVS